MIFPFESLTGSNYEYGLVVAVIIGFAFGFVLERAGFGRATKLAAQFYLYDMTVFKVMFTAIVTAMLGMMIASGLGLADLRNVSEMVVSNTWMMPMLIGGLLLGFGFIIAGYCPGTSAVAAASGSIDGVIAFGGIILGSVVYGESYSMISGFVNYGNLGQLFLYDVFGLPAPVVAFLVTIMAVGMFFGADKVERVFTAKKTGEAVEAGIGLPARRLAFSVLSILAVISLVTMFFVTAPPLKAEKDILLLEQDKFARRILDEPWNLRVIDLRASEMCSRKRVPGSECIPVTDVDKLGLQYDPGEKDLVLIGEKQIKELPEPVMQYKGKVYLLKGGFAGWQEYALTKPLVPADTATQAELDEFRFRAALHAAMTGAKPAAAPARPVKSFKPPKLRKGGGCS